MVIFVVDLLIEHHVGLWVLEILRLLIQLEDVFQREEPVLCFKGVPLRFNPRSEQVDLLIIVLRGVLIELTLCFLERHEHPAVECCLRTESLQINLEEL